MTFIPDQRIDQLISEDIPYLDLTCELLGIGGRRGRMEYLTREDCVLAGGDVAARVMERLGTTVVSLEPDGSRIAAGGTLMVVEGAAGQLHMGWKVALNLFDHLSGVATKTRRMVDAAHRANPSCEVLTTRKSLPGAKDLLTLAVHAGGAWPHRLGLSETVLVFSQHVAFLDGMDGLARRLAEVRGSCVEKKLFVEAGPDEALELARGLDGRRLVDGIQLDKIPVDQLADLVLRLREADPQLTLIAAGGVNEGNAESYAATGVDGIATTAPFNAPPIDMTARMEAI